MDVVQARLAREWTAIEQAGELECWCQVAENCWCAEVGSPVVCLGRLESGDDLLALRLLGLARHGDVAAARVVLQALLPQLGLTLRRGDQVGDHLGMAWERVLRHRPCSTGHVLENLARACRRHEVTELDHRRQLPMAGLDSLAHDERHLRTVTGDHEPHAEDLLADAFRVGIIDAYTVELLRDVYVLGITSSQAGGMRGLSGDAVRDRCRRAIARIRAHTSDAGDVA